MTPRQFVQEEMQHLREVTDGFTPEEFDEYLQQVILELENERQLLCWQDIDD